MKLEQRIAQLEQAHRALSARYEALFMTCKAILPIAISGKADRVRSALTTCYDNVGSDMDALGLDDAYQEMVRAELDDLSTMLLLADTLFPNRN